MKFRRVFCAFALALILGLLVSPVPATAQTLQAFSIERSIALTNIHSTITPTIPANVLAALAGGALEIRETLGYNSVLNTLTSTVFLVPTGSPLPTPPQAIPLATIVAVVTMTIDKIYVTSKPYPAVLFVGTDTQSTATPYGNYLGGSATVSVGYTTDKPPLINNVIETLSGAIVLYSASAAGTITVSQLATPGGGGGGGTGAPTVVITPATQTTVFRQVRLDASGSTDPNGLALKYAWTSVGIPIATLVSNTGPVIDVQCDNGFGLYTFQVTVTNSAGLSSTGTATVQYLGH